MSPSTPDNASHFIAMDGCKSRDIHVSIPNLIKMALARLSRSWRGLASSQYIRRNVAAAFYSNNTNPQGT